MHHHPGSHDPVLVALSVLIAALSSYTALDLATRMRAASGFISLGWLAAAAVAMGGGIWSMHFVAMLAFSLPGVDISYDPLRTLLSLALPILVAAVAFVVVSQRSNALIVAGIGMGLAISGMHYTGMSAMRMAAFIHYDPAWVVLSIVIAIGASIIALRLAFHMTSVLERISAGVVMGLAISGMHYAAMQGSSFVLTEAVAERAASGTVGQAPLAFLIGGTTIVVLMIGLVAAVYDRASAERAGREAEALRRSEERFRLLVEGVADHAIFMLDPEGRVANWNLGASRLIGYGDDIVGMHYGVLHTDEDRDAGIPDALLVDARREGKSEGEGWRVRKDGSRFWAEATIRAVRNERGEIIGFAKIVRDVTERRLAQQALERTRDALAISQKMETVGQLTGGVAHDVNNLIGVITIYLKTLTSELDLTDAQREDAEKIRAATARAGRLTRQLLKFGRRGDLAAEIFDPDGLVEDVFDAVRTVENENVEFVHQAAAEPVTVRMPQTDFEQMLLNLVTNACDAMPDGGTVSLTTEIVDRDARDAGSLPPGRYVSIEVADTGTGMTDDVARTAFEPFVTTRADGEGIGLGLAIVQRVAHDAGGDVSLVSSAGRGTRVRVLLPVYSG